MRSAARLAQMMIIRSVIDKPEIGEMLVRTPLASSGKHDCLMVIDDADEWDSCVFKT